MRRGIRMYKKIISVTALNSYIKRLLIMILYLAILMLKVNYLM